MIILFGTFLILSAIAAAAFPKIKESPIIILYMIYHPILPQLLQSFMHEAKVKMQAATTMTITTKATTISTIYRMIRTLANLFFGYKTLAMIARISPAIKIRPFT